MHDVDISIYNENFSYLNYNKFFDHIHDDFFELETKINISNFKKNKNYIILIRRVFIKFNLLIMF